MNKSQPVTTSQDNLWYQGLRTVMLGVAISLVLVMVKGIAGITDTRTP